MFLRLIKDPQDFLWEKAVVPPSLTMLGLTWTALVGGISAVCMHDVSCCLVCAEPTFADVPI